ncbi:FAD-binding oxidoreductase [Halalkalibacter alkalisediminis]|uniref:FAD-binding oxidoreductase n=1 Tax=Halalkalibacter alkalisediminis TaxID=935616 RepID=A0ABV6NGY1_9BACI|nr:FAD-binding oxidoreductase [Halalkalibacter alkalisediminis]
MNDDFMKMSIETVGTENVVQEADVVSKLSKDYYWYSPILDKKLNNKKADYVIVPDSEETLKAALQLAVNEKIPVTIRGAGTGNYGQAVPMTGGVVVDLTKLNQIKEIGEGFARVQAGMRIRDLEKNVHITDQELTIYPSTFVKATIGGFVSGGSGGIGSVTWGNLWDGNVLEAKVLTMEETVQEKVVTGEELLTYIHSYGTTGIITEVTIPIKPKTRWVQEVISFAHFHEAFEFSKIIAESPRWKKRLVSIVEAPIPTFFRPLKKMMQNHEEHLILIEIAEEDHGQIVEQALNWNGKSIHTIGAEDYRKGIGISDFTWNHTTLWALKADKKWTYLQNFFSLEKGLAQMEQIKERFGDEILFHVEWLKDRGKLIPAGLPLIKYESKERLYEIIDFFNEIGASVNDPHTYLLGAGGWNLQLEAITKKKRENDPFDLLNQEKLPAYDAVKGI